MQPELRKWCNLPFSSQHLVCRTHLAEGFVYWISRCLAYKTERCLPLPIQGSLFPFSVPLLVLAYSMWSCTKLPDLLIVNCTKSGKKNSVSYVYKVFSSCFFAF